MNSQFPLIESASRFRTGRDGGDSYLDYATIKYSSAGVPLWTNRYSGPGFSADQAAAIAVDSSGNAFVTGSAAGSGGLPDYATIKYSNAGVPLWTNRYNGPFNGNDVPQTKQSLAVAPDGVVVVGASDGAFTGGTIYDFATVKYISVPLLAIERSGTDV